MKFGIVVFPGSNCEHDCYHVVKHVLRQEACFLWHKDRTLSGSDCVILPGGFAHGDYLRCGAMAKFSPIMESVVRFSREGGRILGICNGFQILIEAGLLPGALVRNRNLQYICRDLWLRTESQDSPFTRQLRTSQVLRMPVGHGEGCYFADPKTLKRLEAEGRIAFRYCDEKGGLTAEANPNGSVQSIAGVLNEKGNVLGLMPHPDRSAERILGNEDGRKLFESLIAAGPSR
ncbi:MAG TPA: phosphoribosylformylglycinamidine synthase subunit PurQ [Candidatus Polarisedimenticolia bacterium]|nr:phosphoribosylformylglycinamidine synthase subunit PurQ [Candidatus Polarisedimenticolia bacterium]